MLSVRRHNCYFKELFRVVIEGLREHVTTSKWSIFCLSIVVGVLSFLSFPILVLSC